MTEDTETDASAALETLLALQDEDSAADILKRRRATLPERVALAEIEHEIARSQGQVSEAETEKSVYDARLETLAAEVTEIVERAARIDDRLRSGEAGSFRDQEAMATEMGSLDRRRHDLDDEQLILMESIDPLETELGRLADERRLLESERTRARAALSAAEEVIDVELAALFERRSKLSNAVPPQLLSEYERLRARLGGVAVARLVGGACSGCHLTLSASELDHIRHRGPGEVIHCEQCGRILVG